MRQEDVEELLHSNGLDPLSNLLLSLKVSEYTYTVVLGDKIVLMFGCGGIKGYSGVPWMLASDLLLSIKRDFVKECRRIVEVMASQYGYLENYAWSKNKIHIHWLKWLGFTVEPPVPHGINNELFHRFYLQRS
jgi:hypothetical protein